MDRTLADEQMAMGIEIVRGRQQEHQSSRWHGKQRFKEKHHSAHLAARDARANAGYHQQGRHKGPSNRHQPRGGRHKQGEKQDASSQAMKADVGRQLLNLVFE